jgi:hypothetical protein
VAGSGIEVVVDVHIVLDGVVAWCMHSWGAGVVFVSSGGGKEGYVVRRWGRGEVELVHVFGEGGYRRVGGAFGVLGGDGGSGPGGGFEAGGLVESPKVRPVGMRG